MSHNITGMNITGRIVSWLSSLTRAGGGAAQAGDVLQYQNGTGPLWAAASGGYTDEQAQDAIGAMLLDTATIDLVYNDTTPSISAAVLDGSISYAKMQDVSAASRLLGRGSAGGAGDPQEITLGTNLSMAGTTLNAAGGAGASWTTVEQNLGSLPVTRGNFVLVDAAISPTSKVIITQAPGPYTGKGTRSDEDEMDQIWCVAAPGTGQATVRWRVLGAITQSLMLGQGATNAPGGIGFPAATVLPVIAALRLRAVQIGRVKGNFKFVYTVA